VYKYVSEYLIECSCPDSPKYVIEIGIAERSERYCPECMCKFGNKYQPCYRRQTHMIRLPKSMSLKEAEAIVPKLGKALLGREGLLKYRGSWRGETECDQSILREASVDSEGRMPILQRGGRGKCSPAN
jgi:hypothetical protein